MSDNVRPEPSMQSNIRTENVEQGPQPVVAPSSQIDVLRQTSEFSIAQIRSVKDRKRIKNENQWYQPEVDFADDRRFFSSRSWNEVVCWHIAEIDIVDVLPLPFLSSWFAHDVVRYVD